MRKWDKSVDNAFIKLDHERERKIEVLEDEVRFQKDEEDVSRVKISEEEASKTKKLTIQDMGIWINQSHLENREEVQDTEGGKSTSWEGAGSGTSSILREEKKERMNVDAHKCLAWQEESGRTNAYIIIALISSLSKQVPYSILMLILSVPRTFWWLWATKNK